jgi:uncharacterized protein (TIGR02145 family)
VYQGSSDEAANLNYYGRLYNGFAVLDPRGVCPIGFKVPSDEDWMILEGYLGMPAEQQVLTGWRGTFEGRKLKARSTDVPNWDGTNESDFSALPGGRRQPWNGSFDEGAPEDGVWWTSSTMADAAPTRFLDFGTNSIHRGGSDLRSGFSVRCVRDE